MTQRNVTFTNMVPAWVKKAQQNPGSAPGNKISEQELESLRANPLVKERVQDGFPHISSFNYDRYADHQELDSLALSARGLYVNTQTREIVIRGYDKTPQLNQPGLASASLVEVIKNSTGPYTTSVIENGFLAMIGYDRVTDQLLFATKSIVDPDLHEWVFTHIKGTMTVERFAALKTVVSECQITLVFEVLEPETDPHIIENSRSKLVLLDGIRNSMQFEKVSRDQLEAIGVMFDFGCRVAGPSFKDKRALTRFIVDASRNGYQYDDYGTKLEVEGLMIEDANGNMVKFKLPFYEMWRACRLSMEMVSSQKPKSRKPIPADHLADPDVAAFVDWYKVQDPLPAKRNIIKARNAYLAAHPDLPSPGYVGFSIKPEVEAEALAVA